MPDSLTLINLSVYGENSCGSITSSKVVDDGIEGYINNFIILPKKSISFNVYCSKSLSGMVKQTFVLRYNDGKSAYYEIIAKPINADCSEVI
jgi:hypothetical protein